MKKTNSAWYGGWWRFDFVGHIVNWNSTNELLPHVTKACKYHVEFVWDL